MYSVANVYCEYKAIRARRQVSQGLYNVKHMFRVLFIARQTAYQKRSGLVEVGCQELSMAVTWRNNVSTWVPWPVYVPEKVKLRRARFIHS